MADEYRKELVSPTGNTVVSTSERETNDLVFGLGYREPDAKPATADIKPSTPEPKPAPEPPKETL